MTWIWGLLEFLWKIAKGIFGTDKPQKETVIEAGAPEAGKPLADPKRLEDPSWDNPPPNLRR
jgi:hypothetical protein